jgi:hypothetical protein
VLIVSPCMGPKRRRPKRGGKRTDTVPPKNVYVRIHTLLFCGFNCCIIAESRIDQSGKQSQKVSAMQGYTGEDQIQAVDVGRGVGRGVRRGTRQGAR